MNWEAAGALAGLLALPLAAFSLILQWAKHRPKLEASFRQEYSYGFTNVRTDVNLHLRIVNRGLVPAVIEDATLAVLQSEARFGILTEETEPDIRGLEVPAGRFLDCTISFRSPGGHRLDGKDARLTIRPTTGSAVRCLFAFRHPVATTVKKGIRSGQPSRPA